MEKEIVTDIVFGGQGNDVIGAGAGQNIVFGDHGRILGVDTGVNAPVGDPVAAKPDDDYQVQVLGRVMSLDLGDVSIEFLDWPGEGRAVILLHATGFIPQVWTPIAARLSPLGSFSHTQSIGAFVRRNSKSVAPALNGKYRDVLRSYTRQPKN